MRLCFVGDSFVNGVGDPDGLGWVGRVCAAARRQGRDLTCYNLGIRRDATADIAARRRDEVERRLPPGSDGRLVFSFGVNDCVQAVPPAESLGRAADILSQAGSGWPLLMVGPPPIADDAANAAIASLSIALDDLCRGLGVPYLPVCAALLADEVWCREVAAVDGAHPGAAGYRQLADLVDAWPSWLAWMRP